MSDELQDNRKQFFFWDYNGIFDLGLTKHALLVRLFLSRCSGNSPRSSFPSLNTIASKCDISKKSVQRALLELEEKGLVQIQHRKNSETDAQTSNLYVLIDNTIDVFGDGLSDHGVVPHRPRGVVSQTTEEESFKKTKLSVVSFGEYVKMKQSEYDELVERLGKDRVNTLIERINDGVGMYGYKYKDFYKVVLTWHKRDLEKQPQQQQVPFVPSAEETQKMLKRVREGGSSDALQRDSGDGSDWLTS